MARALRAPDLRQERLLENVPIEKENCRERLVLRGGVDALADREVRQERVDFRLPIVWGWRLP